MKYLSKLLSVQLIWLSAAQLQAQGEWKWQLPKNFQHYLSDVAYFGPQTFYLSGDRGDLWKTEDGGQTFTPAAIPNEKSGTSLCFLNENQGWAASGDGAVYYTSNAGTHWSKQFQEPNGATLSAVHFANDSVGYIAGHAGYVDNVLYKTLDGGNNWRPINNLPIRTGASFAGIFFVQGFGQDTVYAVSWNNLLYKSTNGGQSWDTTDIDPAQNASYHEGAYFSDRKHGWVVGPNQSIVHTNDGGKTWANQRGHKDSTHYFSEVYFLDSLKGWASSFDPTGCLFRTENGGATWVKSCGQYGGGRKNALFFKDENNGISTDGVGIYLTNDAGTSFTNVNRNYTEAFNAAAFINSQTAVAVSSGGDVFRTTNGGVNWAKAQTSGRYRPLLSVAMISATTGFAVGDSGYMVKTTDGGLSWAKQPNLTHINLRSIVSLQGSEILLVAGDSNLILRSTDAGTTWNVQTTLSSNSLSAVTFASHTTAIAVGSGGTIFRSVDGGIHWTKATSGTLRNLNDLYFVNGTTGFAAGRSGTILKTIDAGQTWLPLVSGLSTSINSLFFLNENVGWAAGDGVLVTKDGGASWKSDESFLSGNSVRDIYFLDENNGWAFAGNGGILKYEALTANLWETAVASGREVSIYPSPVQDVVKVLNAPRATLKLIVQSLDGQVLKELASGENMFDVSGLKQGIYVARLKWGENSRIFKLIKE